MTIQTKTIIIGNFQNGDVPTGTDFSNLILSSITAAETSAQSMTGGLVITAAALGAVGVSASGSLQLGVTTVSGTGNSQGSATALAVPYNVLTPTSADNAYLMPSGLGTQTWLRNRTAVTAAIFPPTGGAFNGGSTNAQYSLPGSAGVMVMQESATVFITWRNTLVS